MADNPNIDKNNKNNKNNMTIIIITCGGNMTGNPGAQGKAHFRLLLGRKDQT